MSRPDDNDRPWETPSLEWIHRIRAEMAMRRGEKKLLECGEEELAQGIELGKRLGLRFHRGPVSRTPPTPPKD